MFRPNLPFLCFVFLFLLLSVGSLARHYSFHSSAFDLGIFDQSVWHYSRFSVPFNSIKNQVQWGDHFTPLLLFMVPFYWLGFGASALLVVQAASVCGAAYLVYGYGRRIFSEVQGGDRLALLCGLFLVFHPFMQHALAFDVHPETIAAFPLTLGIIGLLERRFSWMWGGFLLSFLAKEDMALYGIGAALWLLYTRMIRQGFVLLCASLGYFLLIGFVVMPHFAGGIPLGGYADFGVLGGSVSELFTTLFTDPLSGASALVNSPLKVGTLALFVAALGGFPLFSPLALGALMVNILPRFLTTEPLRWTSHFHYGVVIVPFAVVGSMPVLLKAARRFPRGTLFLLACGGWISVWSTHASLLSPRWVVQYVTDERRVEVEHVLRLIPENAPVTASSPLVPHVTHRERVYQFPDHYGDATYVLISLDYSPYPLHYHQLATFVQYYQENERYALLWQAGGTYLFRREGGV